MQNRRREGGQILVLFALGLVAMVAMVGLVIDGGFAYSQRRTQQNAADLASLAGANSLMVAGDYKAIAEGVAADNGYTSGGGTIVIVTKEGTARVRVGIMAPHRNYFAGIVGQPTWQVAVTATAAIGVPLSASGSAPIIFSIDAFGPDGLPYAPFGAPFDFTKTKGPGSDAPLASDNMAWTNLTGTSVNSAEVKAALDGSDPIVATLTPNQYIGQANNGVKNTLFDDPSGKPDSVNTALAGLDVVVPIVGPPLAPATQCVNSAGLPDGHTNGCFRGWALFHVVSATKNGGGEDGHVTGYFVSGLSRSGEFTECVPPACTDFHGLTTLKLVN